MILSDFDLRSYLASGRLYVEPFSEEIVRENGLDLRVGGCFCRINAGVRELTVGEGGVDEYFSCGEVSDNLRLDPSAHYLLHTSEYIKMPPELMGFVELRSTFARLGFMMPPTIIDAGFEGQLTIEVLTPPYPIRMKVGTRFLHVVFSKVATPVTKVYRGKYQKQRGVTLPRW